jgi:beta-N-acetylhexosaminidase
MSRLARLWLLGILILNLIGPSLITAQTDDVDRILSALTPEERVGQLFLVAFDGVATGTDSAVAGLITQYHIGGVTLSPATDNFPDTPSFITQTRTLTSALQSIAAGATSGLTGTETPASPVKQFIPLFIAAAYDGENSGATLLPALSGLAPLPSPMALGATWNRIYAENAGNITGQELSALGVNLLIGPTLDVVETPQLNSAADLGALAFGGDPYWVGVMGKSFIQGVHSGSGGRVGVIARHFPGTGASDRALEDQIPTVNKSLDDLRQIDLAPFFAVAAPEAASSADGFLISHIRYRGFQNIRETTKPISFDPQALGALLTQGEISPWRAGGGLTVSEALGVRGVRRFYDATERTFPAFKIALDAFLAGNDMLYLSRFGLNPPDQSEAIQSVIEQFTQKYKEDSAFKLRVDEAVRRILKLKYKLYGGDFSLGAVLTPIELQPPDADAIFAASRDAATLISPASTELADRLPSPPTFAQQIVFFTDSRLARQCSNCLLHATLPADALQQAVLRLYGPQGTRQVSATNLTSFTFADLASFLDNLPPPPTPTPDPAAPATATPEPRTLIGEAVGDAEWLVFSMLDVKSSVSSSNALNRLLAERPDLLRNKRIIVFAFDAPYYLDTTEVSQLTAYYALYSKTPAAIEVAARILFQEVAPTGASPVSIPAVGYDLSEVTRPNPSQVIELSVDTPATAGPTPTPLDPALPTLTPTPIPPNSVIALRTGVIRDRNGNPVPDGTPVEFLITYQDRTSTLASVTTVDGVARTTLSLTLPGLNEISVVGEPAKSSFKLQFTVGREVIVTVVEPPLVVTDTSTPTPTVLPTMTSTPTPTPTPEPPGPQVGGSDFVVALIALIALGGFGWVVTRSRTEAVSAGVKLLLVVAIGIFASYNYYALGLPGTGLLQALGSSAATVVIWAGGIAALGVGWLWLRK